jgi:thymidine kinase
MGPNKKFLYKQKAKPENPRIRLNEEGTAADHQAEVCVGGLNTCHLLCSRHWQKGANTSEVMFL